MTGEIEKRNDGTVVFVSDIVDDRTPTGSMELGPDEKLHRKKSILKAEIIRTTDGNIYHVSPDGSQVQIGEGQKVYQKGGACCCGNGSPLPDRATGKPSSSCNHAARGTRCCALFLDWASSFS